MTSREEKQIINKKEDNMEINDNEIYSTSLMVEELESMRNVKQKDSFRKLMRKIRFNYRIISRIVKEIIDKLKDNLI